jgi:raffinose/stachyose/melibiose transport system permease protein
MKPKYLPYVFMSPAILLLLFVYGGPIIAVFLLSLTDWNGISRTMNFIGLDNFIALASEKGFSISLQNTFLFLILTMVFQNLLALLMAVLLNSTLFGKSFFRTLFFLPSTISIVAIGLIWTLIFDPINGPIVYVANALGWESLANIKWLGNPDIVMYSIAFVNIWQWAGWNMVVYIAGLQSIPAESYESASIDGASFFAKLKYITIPMLAPAITINVVMTTIGGLKVFDLPFVMTGGGPGRASETLAMTIINNSFSLNKMGYGSAMSLILFILILLVTLIQNKVLSRAEEAIKS